MSNKKIRSQRGISGLWIIMLLLVPASVGIGAFAVDVVHIGTVKGALQKACDAGALSGAAEVQNATTSEGMTRTEQAARAVARLNFAEGQPVATDSATGTNVQVDITPPNFGAGEWGRVRVTATKRIRNLFAQIIGRPFEDINCSAVAGPTGNLTGMSTGRWFPLAVSWSNPNSSGQILAAKGLNDTFDLDGSKKGSLAPRNAYPLKKGSNGSGKMWTRFKQFTKTDEFSDSHADPYQSTPLDRGDIVKLQKGSSFSAWLKRADVQAKLLNEILYLPVIDGPVLDGATGKYKGSYGSGASGATTRVIGFVGFKPTAINVDMTGPTKSWKITGQIIKGENYGKVDPSIPSLLGAVDQAKMNSMGVVAIRLLQ